MSETFRFIHAADLHLGSYLNINGNPSQEIQALCKEAVYLGFESICNIGIEYKVDFILICGDVYDSYLRSVRGNKFFINNCSRLSDLNIGVYVIYGNHDAANEKQELFDMPENVHILSSENVEVFEIKKNDEVVAKIIGKSYKNRWEREKIHENYLLDNDCFNIAMLHTALEGDNKNYVPCTMEELKVVPNIDYWALGHIHKTNILSNTKPIIAFPGIPQGRDMGEQGMGGVFYVEVCKKEIVNMEFLPIATIVYKKVDIIINEDHKVENFSDLAELILDKIREKICTLLKISKEFKGHILRLVIIGRTELQDKITHMKEDDYKQLIEDINEELLPEKYFVWVDSLVFRTTPLIQDIENLKMQNSIFNDLDEVISLYKEAGENRSQLVKNWGLIWKKQIFTENIDEDKFDFDEEIIEDIIMQARELIIEKLAEALEIL
jgi:DNA repair protein SbcD/Mre11